MVVHREDKMVVKKIWVDYPKVPHLKRLEQALAMVGIVSKPYPNQEQEGLAQMDLKIFHCLAAHTLQYSLGFVE